MLVCAVFPWHLVQEFVLNGMKQLGKVEWVCKGLSCPKESGRLQFICGVATHGNGIDNEEQVG